jgi:tetratricopeptide (TPR) repeat protein
MDWKTFSLIGRTFSKVFSNNLIVTTNPSGGGIDALLIGFKDRGGLELEYAKQKLTSINKSKNVSLQKPELLFRLIVSEDMKKFFGPGHVNADNHPLLEFAAPKLMYNDDEMISRNMRSKDRITLGKEMRRITETIMADVDAQIDFAAYALSVYSPFQNMVDLLPDRLISAYYLANLYNINGNDVEAIGYYNEVLKNDPYSSKAHSNLGVSLRSLGRFNEAISHFSKALQTDPEYGKAHYNLGVALMEINRPHG